MKFESWWETGMTTHPHSSMKATMPLWMRSVSKCSLFVSFFIQIANYAINVLKWVFYSNRLTCLEISRKYFKEEDFRGNKVWIISDMILGIFFAIGNFWFICNNDQNINAHDHYAQFYAWIHLYAYWCSTEAIYFHCKEKN